VAAVQFQFRGVIVFGNDRFASHVTNLMNLSPEQSAQFAAAVRSAATQHVRDAIANVYRALQDAIDLRQPLCVSSGRCCRFEEYGHRLFVTTMEMAAFVSQLDRPLQPADCNGRGCPFQLNGLCDVHRLRPFGCRIFFCDETSTAWQAEQYERLHAELKRLHTELDVPYFYVEWREALAALSPA
jgi:Fe-S-cluster containining protein